MHLARGWWGSRRRERAGPGPAMKAMVPAAIQSHMLGQRFSLTAFVAAEDPGNPRGCWGLTFTAAVWGLIAADAARECSVASGRM